MANEKNTVVSTVAKYPVTPFVRRTVDTMYMDNENILNTLINPENEDYQKELRIYQETKVLLEEIAKGLKPLPEQRTFPPIHMDVPASTFTATANFYTYAHNLRIMKQLLHDCLGVLGDRHGKYTEDDGLLQFSVPNCTRVEAERLSTLYPDIVHSFYFPPERDSKGRDKKERARVKSTVSVKSKLAIEPIRPTIDIKEAERPVTSNRDEVTTRKATKEEMEQLKKAKEQANK